MLLEEMNREQASQEVDRIYHEFNDSIQESETLKDTAGRAYLFFEEKLGKISNNEVLITKLANGLYNTLLIAIMYHRINEELTEEEAKIVMEFIHVMNTNNIPQEDWCIYSLGWFLSKTNDNELAEKLDGITDPYFEEDEDDEE